MGQPQSLVLNQPQSLSDAEDTLARRLRIYRMLFLISILGNLVVCFWCIFGPVSFARFLHQPDPFPEPWPRIWGATLLGLHLVYVPGLRNPLFYRWPNWSSIAIKFFMTIIFLSSGRYFYPFAAWDFSFGVILLIAYYRLMQADVGRKP
jgi:hypothetical protein